MSGRLQGRRRVLLLVGSLALLGSLVTACSQAETPSADSSPTTPIVTGGATPTGSVEPSSTGAGPASYAAPDGDLCAVVAASPIAAEITTAYPGTVIPTQDPAGAPSSSAPVTAANTHTECALTLRTGSETPPVASVLADAWFFADATSANDAYLQEQAGYALNQSATQLDAGVTHAVYYDTPVGRILYIQDGNLFLTVQYTPEPKTATVEDATHDLLVRLSRALLAGLRQH